MIVITRILPTILTLTIFFLLLFVYTKLAGPIPFSVTSVTTTKSDSFNVTGEGKVSVVPDTAIISVGVTAKGTTVKQAQDQVNTSINKVTEAIKGLGIDEKDIQTTNYTINPNYDYSNNSPRITGYQADANVSVKIRNLDNINSVIDTATANGANQVGNIVFDVDDDTKAENEARQEAVTAAKTRAQEAAKIGGFKLGRLVNYSESFGGGMPPVPMISRALEAAPKQDTQIEPGSTEVVVVVTLSYEIL